MSRYEGPAVLISADGTEVSVDVSLAVTQSGALREWHGTAEVTDRDITDLDDRILQLPNGREGRVILTGPRRADHVNMQGTGPAPF